VKRIFDILVSLSGIVVLLPLMVVVALCILLDAGWPVIFRQVRVGRYGQDFRLYKFRTMKKDAASRGLLTVGDRDPRVTRAGYFLRRLKLDELPQLFNVLNGTMSLVGPRPEVRKYVDLYNAEQLEILDVRPGITDYASLEYFKESELLKASNDPEATYIKQIMPAKLALNKRYISEAGLKTDLKILFRTLGRVLGMTH
jgi:lipopolysaccharide/colanic/teichoic acid biosynthesis glycosyltransferase